MTYFVLHLGSIRSNSRHVFILPCQLWNSNCYVNSSCNKYKRIEVQTLSLINLQILISIACVYPMFIDSIFNFCKRWRTECKFLWIIIFTFGKLLVSVKLLPLKQKRIIGPFILKLSYNYFSNDVQHRILWFFKRSHASVKTLLTHSLVSNFWYLGIRRGV